MRFVQLVDVDQDRPVYINPAVVAAVYASKVGGVSVLVLQGAPNLKVEGLPLEVIAKLTGGEPAATAVVS